MQPFSKPVSHSLILLWSHERGEMCSEKIDAAASTPMGTIVDENGVAIDPSAKTFTPESAYGIHMQYGMVFWAHSIFNDDYVIWPDKLTAEQKTAIIAQFKKTYLFFK